MKQAALTAEHIAKQDIVITTALIPGRPAPKLVSAAMVASMKPGSVIVDLAVERGGNVEGAVPGEIVVTANDVRIVGHLNVPGRVAASASLLYARNLYAFIETLVDKAAGQLAINHEDVLVKATMLTDAGKVVHANFVHLATAGAALEPVAAEPVAAPESVEKPEPFAVLEAPMIAGTLTVPEPPIAAAPAAAPDPATGAEPAATSEASASASPTGDALRNEPLGTFAGDR